MHTRSEHADAVVVGAGPGGATAATLVAMAGHRVVMLEKEQLPIYKVGESLLPSTIHGICPLLGVSDELAAAKFVRKLGGTFRWGTNPEPWTFAFAASSRFSGPTSHAYQVERMKFDKILVDNARRKGVDVREQHAVVDVVADGGRIAGVEVVDPAGGRFTLRARHVVDASGHGTRLARHAGERVNSDFFRNTAIFGYFVGGKRLPPPGDGNIFCAAFDKGWIWYIPLSERLTSVGVVVGHEHAAVLREQKEAAFAQLIGECEQIRTLLADARRSTDPPYDEIRIRKDYSYCHTAFWRPGLALIGDAACFIDPVFSSGVHLATYSGLLAARSINTSLRGSVDEASAFAEFERRYRREYKFFHDFLVAFYDVEQGLNSYYWAARKVLNSPDAGAEAFLRLVGGMAGSDERLISRSDQPVPIEMLSQSLFPAARGAGEMYVDGGASGGAADATDTRQIFMAGLTSETVQMQVQAAGIPLTQKPLFEDGLVVSADGFHWQAPSAAADPAKAFAQVR